MKLLSWNVNSVRLRVNSVARVLRTHEPDVLCLQETKVRNEDFPLDRFRRLGYAHHALAGEKSYNGVAILSKLPIEDVEEWKWCRKRDCRHLGTTLRFGSRSLELHNVYAPAGGHLPDPKRNPKFAHKLRFYRELRRFFERRSRDEPLVLVGDLNVAPLPDDVWSHEKLKRVVTHTPVEVRAMARLRDSLDWVDAVRHFMPPPRRVFTWWSYRAPDWNRVDKGRRLDHAWVTPVLAAGLESAEVLRAVRGFRVPSDHAPVLLELDV
jgi:exodeoxyribonuclease-3